MKRSYLPKVDRLEDRCVPAADLTTTALVEAPTVDDTQVTTDSQPPSTGGYVIDPYLIDPQAPPPATKSPVPDSGWTNPDESPVPPIGDPFWA
jgi:hypothetical protein